MDSSPGPGAELRELWRQLVDAVLDHWPWVLAVVPVTLCTVWSVVASGSRLPLPAPSGPRWSPLSWVSPAWQVGILLGLIVLLCAMSIHAAAADSSDVPGILIVLPILGLGVAVFAGLLLCAAASQRGGPSPFVLVPFLAQVASAGVTLWIAEAL